MTSRLLSSGVRLFRLDLREEVREVEFELIFFFFV